MIIPVIPDEWQLSKYVKKYLENFLLLNYYYCLNVQNIYMPMSYYVKFFQEDIKVSHKTDYANPTAFAWVNSFLGAECNPLIPTVTYEPLGLPGPHMQILKVTCPRDGECDFSLGPDVQTIISSHTLRKSPLSRLTEHPLIVQHLYL